jgi:hypothetical protein
MRGILIGTALCALTAEPVRAEMCRGGPGDQHLVRVGPGPAPLFFALAWNGPPPLERAVAVRCLFAGDAAALRRKDRRGH